MKLWPSCQRAQNDVLNLGENLSKISQVYYRSFPMIQYRLPLHFHELILTASFLPSTAQFPQLPIFNTSSLSPQITLLFFLTNSPVSTWRISQILSPEIHSRMLSTKVIFSPHILKSNCIIHRQHIETLLFLSPSRFLTVFLFPPSPEFSKSQLPFVFLVLQIL